MTHLVMTASLKKNVFPNKHLHVILLVVLITEASGIPQVFMPLYLDEWVYLILLR